MNEKLNTKNFSDKKKILLKSDYDLPVFIKNTEEWSPKLVIANAENMAETAYNIIWKI